MEAVHKNHVAEKDRLVQDLEDTETSISQAEGSTDGLEERYRFFQEMRGYVRDLVECLNEKVGSKLISGWEMSVRLSVSLISF